MKVLDSSPHALRASRFVSALIVYLLGLTLAGCASTMSVEEAKNVTVAFTGSRFVPPPRTTNDILRLLDRERLVEPEVTRQLRAQADEPTPNLADSRALADFYLRRGVAARESGRARQAVDDLRQAARLAPSGQIFHDLGRAEAQGGHLSRALEAFREGIRISPPNTAHWVVPLNATLARFSALSGKFEEAESALRECLRAHAEYLRRPGSADLSAFLEALAAEAQAAVYEARGLFREAEQSRRKVIAAAAPRDTTSQLWSVVQGWRSDLAWVLARQGRLLEAENEVREALIAQLRHRGRNTSRTAVILKTLTDVVAEQGRHSEAEALARELIDIYKRIGVPADTFYLALARHELARALIAQQRWDDALAEYDRIRIDLTTDPETYDKYFKTDMALALTLLKTGHIAAAATLLPEALDRSRRAVGDMHVKTAEIHGVLGMAYRANGELAKAVVEFKNATEVLLNPSRAVDDESTTRSAADLRVTLILESFISTLASLRGTTLERQLGLDGAEEAFRLADVARGRAVQAALDAAAARAAARTPELADLARREQDARKQVSALYVGLSNLLGMPEDQQDGRSLTRLRSDIETLRRAREALTKEIEARFPAYRELLNPRPAMVSQIRAQLRFGEAVIATLVADDETFVWAVPRSGAVAFAVSPIGRKPLGEAIAKVRKSVDIEGIQVVEKIPRFDLSTAYELYRQILEPVTGGWESA